jgi:parvulin-like peptidyl-prolyl isomerase
MTAMAKEEDKKSEHEDEDQDAGEDKSADAEDEAEDEKSAADAEDEAEDEAEHEAEDEAEDEAGDEDEDDEDDDDVAPAKVAAAPIRGLPPPPPANAVDPTWWLPHAVLAALVLLGVLGFFGVFNPILKPLFGRKAAPADTSVAASSASAAQPARPAQTAPAPPQRPTADANAPAYGAKHLVVQWKGATRSKQERSKEEAKARAEEALGKLKKGAEFEKIVAEYSDEPGADKSGGKLGRFTARSIDPQFFAATEKLKVGEMSGVVESAFGYHIIVRTE